MLIQPDKNELGDKRLDPKETVAKLKEDNQKLIDQRKIAHQAMLENQQMALGFPLHFSDFILRVTKLNPKIIVVDSIKVPNSVNVRWVNPLTQEDEYITGFYKEVLPEFSAVVVDDKGLPVREVRGWRTILLAIMKKGLLTEQQVETQFGPATGMRSVLWHEHLFNRRNK